MTCVHTVTYAMLINGQPHEQIHPSRGIRQRDPLSPYLFLICVEGLSHLLRKAGLEHSITGVWQLLGEGQGSIIFSLPMTVSSFIKLVLRSEEISKQFWNYMKLPQVKS
jgi:hypothetical protein